MTRSLKWVMEHAEELADKLEANPPPLEDFTPVERPPDHGEQN